MAGPVPNHNRLEGKADDIAERQARFAANRREHERLKKEVERKKRAKEEALRLKLEQEELEDKRIQDEILRMQAELEELDQPSPNTANEHSTEEEEHGAQIEQAVTATTQAVHTRERATPTNTSSKNEAGHAHGLSEDVENLITQEARKGQSLTLPTSEPVKHQDKGVSETSRSAKHKSTLSGESSNGGYGSLFVDNSYESRDEVLRNYLTASVDGSNRVRLAEYLKECEKFFKSKANWLAGQQIDFAILHLVGSLLTKWRESATKLRSPTWEDYKIALFKANTQLECPQTHSCKRCAATFGSEGSLSKHTSQSRPCRITLPPLSPTARKTRQPHNGVGEAQNGASSSENKLTSRQKSVVCPQCNLTFPSTDALGRHKDVTGHAVSPSRPKSSLIHTPTGPKRTETNSSLSNLPSQSTNACQTCNTSFRNQHDLVQHLHDSGHMVTKERHITPATNQMGAPAHSNSANRSNYSLAARANNLGSPMPDSRDPRDLDRRTCRTCNRSFSSRMEMHEHLRDSNHAVATFPPRPQRSNPNPFPEPSLSLHQRTSGGSGGGGYTAAQHYSSSNQDDDYIGLGPSSDSPSRSRAYKDPSRTCEKCDTEFPTRIEMFEHIREANHVMPRKRVYGRYDDDGGLGGRVSVVRRRTDY